MNRFVISMLSLALAFAGFIAPASGDARTTELLAQARAAVGGESRLANVHGLSAAGTYLRQAGDRQLEGELTLDVQLPDKMVRTDSMNPIGDTTIVVLQGINGDQVLRNTRTISGGPNMMIRMAPPGAGADAEGQALRNQRAELARLAFALLLTSPPSMPLEYEYAGEAESDEGKADVVDAKGPGSFALKLFLDKKSHRPLMLQYRGAAPRIVMQTQVPRAAGHGVQPGSGNAPPLPPPDAPQIVDITMFLDDYRAVDGLLMPHHISRSIDGSPNEEWTFKTIKQNPTFAPDTFSGK